ncbi:MAG: hypothetical protein J6Y82_06885 [Bacteroidales bacterium]|nr:hypothetical protein [Bacteroidales bacterium]
MISLFDLKGNHKMNIYGPQWGRTHLDCFGKPTFTKDYLIALYNGEIYEQYLPTHKCLVFSKSGDYLATLELEYKTNTLCYDAENDRLIFTFDDVIQFGYLNLSDLNFE